MRIVSGKLNGRIIKAPSGHTTHPMSEKIRGAVFNALGDIEGLSVLDAFSGSGAIAIEAWSRGAKGITAIDRSQEAIKCIQDNVRTLGIPGIKITRANVSTWSDLNSDKTYDIIVCDPPYDSNQISTIQKLEKHLNPIGVFVLSLPPGPIYNTKLKKISEKDYNDAKLYFYKKT